MQARPRMRHRHQAPAPHGELQTRDFGHARAALTRICGLQLPRAPLGKPSAGKTEPRPPNSAGNELQTRDFGQKRGRLDQNPRSAAPHQDARFAAPRQNERCRHRAPTPGTGHRRRGVLAPPWASSHQLARGSDKTGGDVGEHFAWDAPLGGAVSRLRERPMRSACRHRLILLPGILGSTRRPQDAGCEQ